MVKTSISESAKLFTHNNKNLNMVNANLNDWNYCAQIQLIFY